MGEFSLTAAGGDVEERGVGGHDCRGDLGGSSRPVKVCGKG